MKLYIDFLVTLLGVKFFGMKERKRCITKTMNYWSISVQNIRFPQRGDGERVKCPNVLASQSCTLFMPLFRTLRCKTNKTSKTAIQFQVISNPFYQSYLLIIQPFQSCFIKIRKGMESQATASKIRYYIIFLKDSFLEEIVQI